MNVRNTLVTVVCFFTLASSMAFGQAGTQSPASFDFNNEGIVFRAQDTNTRVVMRFRMQNWATYTTKTQNDGDDIDLSAGSSDFVTRRFRLRFGGSLFDPRLTFNFQMAFSRVDLDFADASFPNVIRGAGPESRQIHDFGGVQALDADRFIVVEVIVPAGNWSGVPPHKHDTYIPGVESNLEEIYYFELAPERNTKAPEAVDPKGFFRGYSADDRPYDITTEVRSGDVVLVPYGWHGPIGTAPAYDMYFMNVMAGPDPDRSWNVTDEPEHAWIRKTWESKLPDPRLPYTE